jgi:hypothetical protein
MSRLDLAREINLRRWARVNYVPAEMRPATWHPVVLHEMRTCDSERAEVSSPAHFSPRYVPLLPTSFAGSEFCEP